MVKDELEECSIRKLKGNTQAEIKTQQNDWESNTGETYKEKDKNSTEKKKKDKERSRKRGCVGIEDEKTVKGSEEGKSSLKKKRKKDRADADQPKKQVERKTQKAIGKDVKEETEPWKW